MELLEVIDDILEQEDCVLPKKEIVEDDSIDEDIFSIMANFIINLDPYQLSEEEVQEVIEIIESIEEEEDIQELRTPKLARRTLASKNQKSKRWYRKNRTQIKRRKAKFKRSSEGRKRLKAKQRLARQGRTPTGRRKVCYHRRKRDKDRENREYANRR